MADGVALNKKVGGETKYKFAIHKPLWWEQLE